MEIKLNTIKVDLDQTILEKKLIIMKPKMEKSYVKVNHNKDNTCEMLIQSRPLIFS